MSSEQVSAASAGVGKYQKFVELHTHWGSLILEPRFVDLRLETVVGRILDFPKSKTGLDAADKNAAELRWSR